MAIDCVFPEPECCSLPTVTRTGTISRFIIKLTSYTPDELCVLAGNPKLSKDHKQWFHFMINDNGDIVRLSTVDNTFADPVIDGSDPEIAVYIGLTYPMHSASSCTVIPNKMLEDSLTRIICCVQKSLGLTTTPIIETEYAYDDELDYLYAWMNPVIIRLSEKRVPECLAVNENACFECTDVDDEDEGSCCNCTSSCSKTCGCTIIPLYCRQIGMLDNLQADFSALQNAYAAVVAKYDSLRAYIDTQVPQINSLAQTATQFQNFYGTYIACLRKLCVLDGCFDCKVHYSVFAPQTIFPGVYVPLNFEKKITDNDPSDVSTLGYFRFCPTVAGMYRVELTDLTLAPAKYCAGDVVEIRLSNGNVIHTLNIASNTDNLIVQLPAITSEIYLNGTCLSVELRVTSKEAVTRKLVDGHIVIYQIS